VSITVEERPFRAALSAGIEAVFGPVGRSYPAGGFLDDSTSCPNGVRRSVNDNRIGRLLCAAVGLISDDGDDVRTRRHWHRRRQ
jgi:hypothetical protein